VPAQYFQIEAPRTCNPRAKKKKREREEETTKEEIVITNQNRRRFGHRVSLAIVFVSPFFFSRRIRSMDRSVGS